MKHTGNSRCGCEPCVFKHSIMALPAVREKHCAASCVRGTTCLCSTWAYKKFFKANCEEGWGREGKEAAHQHSLQEARE